MALFQQQEENNLNTEPWEMARELG